MCVAVVGKTQKVISAVHGVRGNIKISHVVTSVSVVYVAWQVLQAQLQKRRRKVQRKEKRNKKYNDTV